MISGQLWQRLWPLAWRRGRSARSGGRRGRRARPRCRTAPGTAATEPVGEDHLALRAGRDTLQVVDGADPVAHAQIDLIGVRVGEGVWLPERHCRPFCRMAARSLAFRRRGHVRSSRSPDPTVRVGSVPPQVDSPLCEEFGRTPRGQQGQAVRRGRGGRVRSRHRSGVQDDRPRGQAPGLPRRQGAPPGARGPHRDRSGPRAGVARRGPAVSRQGGARARRRPDRDAAGRDHRG